MQYTDEPPKNQPGQATPQMRPFKKKAVLLPSIHTLFTGSCMSDVVTRFAPSPTGMLHLGGARTALFTWLFTRHMKGHFLLRIEDTDHARNSQEALDSILEGLDWLGLHHDDAPVFQSKNKDQHQQIARELLSAGHAYWCDTPAEICTQLKEAARTQGKAPLYPSRETGAAQTSTCVLRFKMPRTGDVTFTDLIQGAIVVQADQLEDLVLLRSDGSPTYMLSVVADDHAMGITHVVRGTDHLSNTPKQLCLYRALGWTPPTFAHVPLIHGADGAKLSKRHGALDVRAYREQGVLPDALFNALLRLGWGHGNQEHFTRDEAITLFTLEKIGRSPARFDPPKLAALNAHALRALPAEELLKALTPFLSHTLSEAEHTRLTQGLPALAERAETLVQLADNAALYFDTPPQADAKAQKLLTEEAKALLSRYADALGRETSWTADHLEAFTRAWVAEQKLALKHIALPLRAALTGRAVSPPVFEVMHVLGKALCLQRLG